MKLLLSLLITLLFFSCKKNNEGPLKLIRKEATTYTGVLQTTEYVYDSQNRIIAVKQGENNATPATFVTVSYTGNEAVLISHPTYDPAFDITKEVRLILNGSGQLLKKTGYVNMVAKTNPLSRRSRHDTLVCEYDAAGFLKYTTWNLFDSTQSDPGYTAVDQAITKDTFTTTNNNLVKKDRLLQYTRTITNGGGTTISGGSAENHSLFGYEKLYPNKTDFTNAAILNEVIDYSGTMDWYEWVGYFETQPEQKYQHMPKK